eukprot:PhM_4_TR388/c5_g1_i9/m.106700
MSSPRLSRTSLPGLGTFVLTSSTTSSSSAAANISENNNNNTLVVDVDASPRREYPISRTPDTIIVTPASWRPPPIPKRMSLAHPTLQLHHHSPKHRQNHSPTSSQSSTSPMSTQREERSSSILSLTTSADSPISNIAIIMLGLGLRHACLNNVSADPPAKDTPHACYISLRPIAIGDYLRRFDKFAQCSDECYAVAAVLLDRWCAATGVQLHRSIVHKLTLTALVVALKMYDDQQYPMDWYAQVGGVETPELMALERRFLRTIAWRVVVGHDEYVQYVAMMRRALDAPDVERHIALAGFGRGPVATSPFLRPLRRCMAPLRRTWLCAHRQMDGCSATDTTPAMCALLSSPLEWCSGNGNGGCSALPPVVSSSSPFGFAGSPKSVVSARVPDGWLVYS